MYITLKDYQGNVIMNVTLKHHLSVFSLHNMIPIDCFLRNISNIRKWSKSNFLEYSIVKFNFIVSTVETLYFVLEF